MGIRRVIVLSVVLLLASLTLFAQRENYHEVARYEQMNRQGVWAVGLGIDPVVGLSHPVSYTFGNGRQKGTGTFGVNIEGSYFVVDNMSIVASYGYVGNSWGNMMRMNYRDASTALSSMKLRLGARWHMGRWALGGGLFWGRSTLRYTTADLEGGGVNSPIYGDADFSDRRPMVGLFYEGAFQVNPFLKASLFYEPALTSVGGRYCHTLGARLTIYLPFMDAVVCR